MKTNILKTITMLTVSAFSLTACFEMTSNATDAQASVQSSLSEAVTAEVLSMPCGFDNRATTEKMSDQPGVIMTLPNANEPEGIMYLISVPDQNRRFTACNMPQSLKKDGMKILFSGEVKEIMPEEKWVATPYKLSAVRILE